MKAIRLMAALACLVVLIGGPGCSRPQALQPAVVVPPAAPEALPPVADGIAFVRDGSAFVVEDGVEREIADDGARKVAVGYSADGRSLLVTEERGSRRSVLALPVGPKDSDSVVLESAEGSAFGAVRANMTTGRLFYSVFGEPANRLLAAGLTPTSTAEEVALQGTFSGEFDVDASGKSIVYTGSGQNPATVMLRLGTRFEPLATGLATAFTPAFSREGERVCFAGSESSGGPIAVWVVDRGSGVPRPVPGTERLRPTVARLLAWRRRGCLSKRDRRGDMGRSA